MCLCNIYLETYSQCWLVNWNIGNRFQWNFNQNSNISIQENPFENVVCKFAVILSPRHCVDISLKFVPKGPVSSKPSLVQIMAWRPPDNKPGTTSYYLKQCWPSLLTHIWLFGLNDLMQTYMPSPKCSIVPFHDTIILPVLEFCQWRQDMGCFCELKIWYTSYIILLHAISCYMGSY